MEKRLEWCSSVFASCRHIYKSLEGEIYKCVHELPGAAKEMVSQVGWRLENKKYEQEQNRTGKGTFDVITVLLRIKYRILWEKKGAVQCQQSECGLGLGATSLKKSTIKIA